MKTPIENFLATFLPKLCQQVELKSSEIRKKFGDFVVKTIRLRDVL